MSKLDQLLQIIKTKLEELDSLRPIENDRMKLIYDKYRLELNYYTNHIEGNTLTIGETKSLILLGLESSISKKVRDIEEMRGHIKVFESLGFLTDRVLTVDKLPLVLDQKMIRELHRVIFVEDQTIRNQVNGVTTESILPAGNYKVHQNHVITNVGEMFKYAEPFEVPQLMSDLVDWYNSARENLELVTLTSIFHYKFIRIHPFGDGNGRMARLLMNLILQSGGYGLVIVKDKDSYLNSLSLTDNNFLDLVEVIHQEDTEKFSPFVEKIAELETDSLDLMIRAAKGEDISEVEDIIKIAEMREKSKQINQAYSLDEVLADPILKLKAEEQIKKILSTVEDYFERVVKPNSLTTPFLLQKIKLSNSLKNTFDNFTLYHQQFFKLSYTQILMPDKTDHKMDSIDLDLNTFLSKQFNVLVSISYYNKRNVITNKYFCYIDPDFDQKLKDLIREIDDKLMKYLNKE